MRAALAASNVIGGRFVFRIGPISRVLVALLTSFNMLLVCAALRSSGFRAAFLHFVVRSSGCVLVAHRAGTDVIFVGAFGYRILSHWTSPFQLVSGEQANACRIYQRVNSQLVPENDFLDTRKRP